MSADNGYVIQMNDQGRYVLQYYCASADSYPDPNRGDNGHETLALAMVEYAKFEDREYPTEYGLSINQEQIDVKIEELSNKATTALQDMFAFLPVPPSNVTGWTHHGHAIQGGVQTAPSPSNVARCGGENICTQCSDDARSHWDEVFPQSTTSRSIRNICTQCSDDARSHWDEVAELRHKINKENKMDIQKFSRKPFEVQAVQVTSENMVEVAEWCTGIITLRYPERIPVGGESFIKVNVHRPAHSRQTEAHVGDWVLKTKNGFKVYSNSAFEKNFHPALVFQKQ